MECKVRPRCLVRLFVRMIPDYYYEKNKKEKKNTDSNRESSQRQRKIVISWFERKRD